MTLTAKSIRLGYESTDEMMNQILEEIRNGEYDSIPSFPTPVT